MIGRSYTLNPSTQQQQDVTLLSSPFHSDIPEGAICAHCRSAVGGNRDCANCRTVQVFEIACTEATLSGVAILATEPDLSVA